MCDKTKSNSQNHALLGMCPGMETENSLLYLQWRRQNFLAAGAPEFRLRDLQKIVCSFLILAHFVHGTQPIPTRACATAGPGLAPPMYIWY